MNEENLNSHEKSLFSGTNTKVIQMLELSYKDFQALLQKYSKK